MTVAHANRQFQTNGKAELSISTESNSITFYLNVHFPSAVSFSLLRVSRYANEVDGACNTADNISREYGSIIIESITRSAQ